MYVWPAYPQPTGPALLLRGGAGSCGYTSWGTGVRGSVHFPVTIPKGPVDGQRRSVGPSFIARKLSARAAHLGHYKRDPTLALI